LFCYCCGWGTPNVGNRFVNQPHKLNSMTTFTINWLYFYLSLSNRILRLIFFSFSGLNFFKLQLVRADLSILFVCLEKWKVKFHEVQIERWIFTTQQRIWNFSFFKSDLEINQ
jgi:hypothetical protein